MMCAFQYAGFTHHDTPMEMRDQIARASASPSFFQALRDRGQFILLSTCARFEIYTCGSFRTPWPDWLRRHLNLARTDMGAVLKTMTGEAVARHLLRVAAGLDSRILGEDHIQAQVREALKRAQRERTCSADLEALWRAAICTGRRVRSETAVSRSASSYAKVAVDDVRPFISDTRNSRVLVCGTGAVARETLRILRALQVKQLAVCSHRFNRARELAHRTRCTPLCRSQLPEWFGQTRAVITCTKSPGYVVTPDMLNNHYVKLRIVDLGMPRNVDPRVAALPGVSLRNLDDLAPCAAIRAGVISRAECIIDEQLRKLEISLQPPGEKGQAAQSRCTRQELAA